MSLEAYHFSSSLARVLIALSSTSALGFFPLFLDQFRVETEALQLLDQDIEGLGKPGLQGMLPLDNGLVDPGPSCHVIRFHRQEFLEGMSGAIGLKGPDLHLSEALAAELGLSSEGLLGHQRIGSDGTGVDLVIHQVVQFEKVHVADGHLLVEGLSGPSVVEGRLPDDRELCLFQVILDLLLRGSIKDRNGDKDPVCPVFGPSPAPRHRSPRPDTHSPLSRSRSP